jgi:putative ABC transport system ATP-binding protein
VEQIAPTDGAPAIDLAGVRFTWPGAAGGFALEVQRFRVGRGERVLLVGPSGSGKSTLLGLICGTLRPQAGRLVVLDTDLAATPAAARDRFRAEHIGVIFQMFNLLPYLSILDNILLPLSFAPRRAARAAAAPGGARGEARRLVETLGLDLAALAHNDAAELSVGQQQRVAAARALIGVPEIVVADEPTSALDRDRQDAFLSLLFSEVARAGATLLMVSHEERFTERFDRKVALAELTGSAAAAGMEAALP